MTMSNRIRSRAMRNALLALTGLLLVTLYFAFGLASREREDLLSLARDSWQSLSVLIADTRLDLEYALLRRKHTLTVNVDSPELFQRIEVYSGYPEGLIGDPRYGTHRFTNAELVAQQDMNPSGSLRFVLRPGRYFIYPVFDYESRLMANQSQSLIGLSTEVFLDHDVEIKPNLLITH